MDKQLSRFNFTYNPNEFNNLREESEHSVSQQPDEPTSTRDETDALPPPTSVAAVKSAMTNTRLAAYLADFDRDTLDEARVFCSVPATHVDDTARAQLLAGGVEKEDEDMHHQNELEHIDFLKRNRIMELEEIRQRRRTDQLSSLRSIDLMRQQTSELVDTYYDHAHRELDIHLTSRQGEVSQSIGEIRKFRRGDYDPDKPDWSRIPQQVQIQVVEIRGVKDKVPKGDYIVLVSQWDKLGGKPLRWSAHSLTGDQDSPPCYLHWLYTQDIRAPMSVRKRCEICNGWAGGTRKVHHEADPRDYDLAFNSGMSTIFLPQTRIKPYNALLFELVKLPDKSRKAKLHDTENDRRPQVVGWGVMPIVNAKFEVINGKFRFPMLRGPYKPHFGHYKTIAESITDDLENWLGNMYVEVVPESRKYFGKREFDLQSEYAERLLNLSHFESAKSKDGWPVDGKKRGASVDATNNPTQKLSVMGGGLGSDFTFEEEFPYQRPTKFKEDDTDALTRWSLLRTAVFDRRKRIQEQERVERERAIAAVRKQEAFRYSIHPYGSTNLESTWRIQVEYCMRAIKDELNLRDPLSARFYLVCFVFFVSLYFQLYIHGVFVWLALRASGVPIDSVDPMWYGLHIKYLHRQTTPLQEVFVVFFSQISCYFFLLAEISVGWGFKVAAGSIPEELSKFVFTTSLAAMLIPFVEIILDISLKLNRSDWYRLTNFFNEHEYGSYFTPLVFGIIYFFMVAGCVVSTFLYTMGLHLNGILQDSYWRIMIVNEDTCHIPNDLEVSIPELKHIMRKAEQWRGKHGERRKISVYKLETTHREDEDEDDEDHHIVKKKDRGFFANLFRKDDEEYRRVDMHIQICQLNCGDTERWRVRQEYEVYREFMIQEDGAILEAVGDRRPHGITFTLNTLAKKLKLGTFGAGDAATGGGAADIIMNLFGGGGGGGGHNLGLSESASPMAASPTKGKSVRF